MQKSKLTDPFEKARLEKGFGEMNDQNDPVVMVLGHKDIRRCAHNWKTFQSGAEPGRIVIPSEVNIRNTRQIPFELDPPLHGAYRAVVEPWFKRPLETDYESALTKQIQTIVDETLEKDTIEVVREFSLVLQSRALTLLFNVPTRPMYFTIILISKLKTVQRSQVLIFILFCWQPKLTERNLRKKK